MTYDDARIDVLRTAATWDEVDVRWLELDRTISWFHGHRWIVTAAEVFGPRSMKAWPPADFGGLAAPLEHVDGLVFLGRGTGWSRQASWVE